MSGRVQPTEQRDYDRVTGRPATVYTPPEDRVTKAEAIALLASDEQTTTFDDDCR